jgi:phenylacetate-CoA ligase
VRISHDVAAKWRATRWWDVDIGDPEIVLWGSAIETTAQGLAKRVRDYMLRTELILAAQLNEKRMDEVLDQLAKSRPKMLFGYPSILSRLALHAKQQGREMGNMGVKVAFVTSEMLQPSWRRIIGEVFGCGVANEYGARDAGFIARECPEGNLHVSAEDIIVETVDDAGFPVGKGQKGEVVVTHLCSSGFPFLRYRTGDVAVLDNSLCSCGRSLPLIREICGRTNDCLTAVDGSVVHGSALNYVLRGLRGVASYKIIQEESHLCRVLIVASDDFRKEQIISLHASFSEHLGLDMRIRVECVDVIQPEASGKFHHIVNRYEKPV